MGLLSNRFLEDTLPQFMSLRVLSLSYYHNIVKLPNSCSGFKQLRFLNLSSTGIKELSESICSFYNLQTLLLSNCRELEELPANLGKLINLCCLDISGTPLKKMPPQMGRLINLQVLTAFVIGKGSGSTIKELGKLSMLILSGLENVSSGRDASMANMKGKEHLDELTLEWNGSINDSQAVRDVLGNLQPHSSIKHLKIIGYGGTTFPDWLGNSLLSHLESLSLSNCENCFSLPALGQLQSFQSLEIELRVHDCGSLSPSHVSRLPASLKSLEYKGCCNLELESSSGEGGGALERLRLENCDSAIVKVEWLASFPMLKYVEIYKCKSVEMISVPAAPAPGIGNQKLSIYDYPRLQSLPEEGLPTFLTALVLTNCPLLEPRLEWDKGQDWPKVAHIPCIVVDWQPIP
ncbi:unnamed protein product [Coffea canephora]|uniref:R13L1/DRL21-like LRR repeat region domain-containing protein n=1 Tax=Coffea canephora TaxID=49390 RepID=A0A068UZU6_COFCA|nr:unnamed protein product [Coffea canephora]